MKKIFFFVAFIFFYIVSSQNDQNDVKKITLTSENDKDGCIVYTKHGGLVYYQIRTPKLYGQVTAKDFDFYVAENYMEIKTKPSLLKKYEVRINFFEPVNHQKHKNIFVYPHPDGYFVITLKVAAGENKGDGGTSVLRYEINREKPKPIKVDEGKEIVEEVLDEMEAFKPENNKDAQFTTPEDDETPEQTAKRLQAKSKEEIDKQMANLKDVDLKQIAKDNSENIPDKEAFIKEGQAAMDKADKGDLGGIKDLFSKLDMGKIMGNGQKSTKKQKDKVDSKKMKKQQEDSKDKTKQDKKQEEKDKKENEKKDKVSKDDAKFENTPPNRFLQKEFDDFFSF